MNQGPLACPLSLGSLPPRFLPLRPGDEVTSPLWPYLSPGQCHVSSVPVFNSMRQPEVKTWGGVVTAAMVIALAVYMGTGERSPPEARLECSHSLLSFQSFWPSFPREALHS